MLGRRSTLVDDVLIIFGTCLKSFELGSATVRISMKFCVFWVQVYPEGQQPYFTIVRGVLANNKKYGNKVKSLRAKTNDFIFKSGTSTSESAQGPPSDAYEQRWEDSEEETVVPTWVTGLSCPTGRRAP